MSTSWVELVGLIDQADPLRAAGRPAGERPVGAFDAEPQLALRERLAEQAGATVVDAPPRCRRARSAASSTSAVEPHALLAVDGERLEIEPAASRSSTPGPESPCGSTGEAPDRAPPAPRRTRSRSSGHPVVGRERPGRSPVASRQRARPKHGGGEGRVRARRRSSYQPAASAISPADLARRSRPSASFGRELARQRRRRAVEARAGVRPGRSAARSPSRRDTTRPPLPRIVASTAVEHLLGAGSPVADLDQRPRPAAARPRRVRSGAACSCAIICSGSADGDRGEVPGGRVVAGDLRAWQERATPGARCRPGTSPVNSCARRRHGAALCVGDDLAQDAVRAGRPSPRPTGSGRPGSGAVPFSRNRYSES